MENTSTTSNHFRKVGPTAEKIFVWSQLGPIFEKAIEESNSIRYPSLSIIITVIVLTIFEKLCYSETDINRLFVGTVAPVKAENPDQPQ
tara:strand:- start:524 stop:790 length:267 start_codon:yes stop_codon:yes gene_type:complete